jgi:hypothetical protein
MRRARGPAPVKWGPCAATAAGDPPSIFLLFFFPPMLSVFVFPPPGSRLFTSALLALLLDWSGCKF